MLGQLSPVGHLAFPSLRGKKLTLFPSETETSKQIHAVFHFTFSKEVIPIWLLNYPGSLKVRLEHTYLL